MTSLDTTNVPAMAEALTAHFDVEDPDIAAVAAFIDEHPELGFTLRPSYFDERGIMVDAAVRVQTDEWVVYELIVQGGLFGPFGAEWDTAIGESVDEIAARIVAASVRARGLCGRHLTLCQ